jgi:hypothetical protein
VPLGATTGSVQNYIGQSVEKSSEMIPYLCRNALLVECTLCLVKAAIGVLQIKLYHRELEAI